MCRGLAAAPGHLTGQYQVGPGSRGSGVPATQLHRPLGSRLAAELAAAQSLAAALADLVGDHLRAAVHTQQHGKRPLARLALACRAHAEHGGVWL